MISGIIKNKQFPNFDFLSLNDFETYFLKRLGKIISKREISKYFDVEKLSFCSDNFWDIFQIMKEIKTNMEQYFHFKVFLKIYVVHPQKTALRGQQILKKHFVDGKM